MSGVRICVSNAPSHPLPQLGHGLWIDHLEDIAGTEALIRQLGGAHLDMLVDLRQAGSPERLQAALALSRRANVEAWLLAIVSDEHPQLQLQDLAHALEGAPCRPEGILVTPAAYLRSYQPDGVWPAGPTPDDVAALARELLPGYRIGGGVPTYFTELNRCRPVLETFDYLTHATSPIVHAADDLSVMESIESLEYIARSARQLAHGKPYRLTTSAIGAWCNPYGGQLTLNPDRDRLTLSDQDPRQRGVFGAAWTLGHYAAVHHSAMHHAGVDAVALWAVNEPFAVASAGAYWPIFHVLRGLNRARGKTTLNVDVSSPDIAALAWRQGPDIQLWLANLTGQDLAFDLAGLTVHRATQLDAGSADLALEDPEFMDRRQPIAQPPVALGPYGVMALDCRWSVECGL